ncbi:MAG: FHA domain-containing protein [Isosphaeraceae bacterium]
MPTRLVALSEGADIPLDRAMIVVGRHPQCDARLDSIRVSRRHCCMTPDNGEVIVRDLGSTNGIRINDQRVEMGRLRAGDVLSIAHLRYRLEAGEGFQDQTLADNREVRDRLFGGSAPSPIPSHGSVSIPVVNGPPPGPFAGGGMASPIAAVSVDSMPNSGAENPLAALVRDALARELGPMPLGDRCQIQVILQMKPEAEASGHEGPQPCPSNSSP